jgi:hypothetical protein
MSAQKESRDGIFVETPGFCSLNIVLGRIAQEGHRNEMSSMKPELHDHSRTFPAFHKPQPYAGHPTLDIRVC